MERLNALSELKLVLEGRLFHGLIIDYRVSTNFALLSPSVID